MGCKDPINRVGHKKLFRTVADQARGKRGRFGAIWVMTHLIRETTFCLQVSFCSRSLKMAYYHMA